MTNVFNMLYERYIEQIKFQQIYNYNNKHSDHLKRIEKGVNTFDKCNTSIRSNNMNNLNNKKDRVNNVKKQQQQIRENQNILRYHMDNEKNKYTKTNSPQKISRDQIQIKPISNQSNLLTTSTIKTKNQFTSQFPQEQVDYIVLNECPEGCGRKFKAQALDKHVKVCQKIFQQKRKPFKVDLVDDQAKKLSNKNKKQQKNKQKQKQKQDKIPKWKRESEKLRQKIKGSQIGSTTIPEEQLDNRKQCPGCGRKFNETAAERHIPNCVKKIKNK